MAKNFHAEFGFLPSPRQLVEDSRLIYDHWGASTLYAFNRGLSPSVFTQECYLITELPQFRGKDFVLLVTDEIKRRKAENMAHPEKPYKQVVIADIGYGAGLALLDMRELWKDDVVLIGYGNSYHTDLRIVSDDGKTSREATRSELTAKGIQLVEGDIIDIRSNFRESFGDDFHVDFLLMSNVMQYVRQYPAWELLKKLYRILRPEQIEEGKILQPGGILLTSYFPNVSFEHDILLSQIFDDLNGQGYAIEREHGRLAMQRTAHDLPTDIRSVGIDLGVNFVRRVMLK